MTQRYDLCPEHTMGKLLIMYESQGESKHIQLTAYEEQFSQIVGQQGCITPEVLPHIKSVTYIKKRSSLVFS